MKLILSALALLAFSFDAVAATPRYVICKRNSDGAINIKATRCKRTETKLSNISSLTGADGSLRIYGDGSAGSLLVTSSTAFDESNLQYTDITVDTGVTLTVESGTIFRATGAFTNNGTITVSPYAAGASIGSAAGTSGTSPAITLASPGVAVKGGSQGAFGTSAATLAGGEYGLGMFPTTARNILAPGVLGGSGGGAGAFNHSGGKGGGTFTVIAAGAILNNGSINADGSDGGSGSGGGGGGIIILASNTSVTNSASGSITARGGAGGASNVGSGAGGGGGGGIVHFLAPTAPTNSGSIYVSEGAAGNNTTAVTNSPRSGGGGGGSCGGDGGPGSAVSAGNVSSGSSTGAAGFSLTTTADPTSLF
ncbi:MAG: hypothetical protein K1X83_03530 [Oligoflexia bacterium]|nr:hypothetical protein [Oligoflexia bacterium]